VANLRRGLLGQGWLETFSVTFSLDHEVIGVAGEAIEGYLHPDGVGEGREPFVGAAVGGNDDGAGAMAFGEHLVGVAAFGCVHGIEPDVVEDQQVDGGESAYLGIAPIVDLDRLLGRLVKTRLDESVSGEVGSEDSGPKQRRIWHRNSLTSQQATHLG